MSIRYASLTDLKFVTSIVCQTIQTIYSRYYPKGAVDFFLLHHREANITADIVSQNVFVLEVEKVLVGTVTIKEFEICRLFVLPQYQGKGYGRALLDFAEKLIAEKYRKIRLDASLPAKEIYLKRGYRETESHSILTENGDYLFYDVMEKDISMPNFPIDYDGKVFITKVNSENVEVKGVTLLFHFKELEISELPQVAKLYNELAFELKETTNDSYFDFETLSIENMLDTLKNAIQENRIKIYVAKHSVDVIGYISGTITSCFLPVSSVNKIGYIEAAYVIKDFRNRNVMKQLEERLVEYFKNEGVQFVELNVLSANITGKNYWNKSGYTTFREQMRKKI